MAKGQMSGQTSFNDDAYSKLPEEFRATGRLLLPLYMKSNAKNVHDCLTRIFTNFPTPESIEFMVSKLDSLIRKFISSTSREPEEDEALSDEIAGYIQAIWQSIGRMEYVIGVAQGWFADTYFGGWVASIIGASLDTNNRKIIVSALYAIEQIRANSLCKKLALLINSPIHDLSVVGAGMIALAYIDTSNSRQIISKYFNGSLGKYKITIAHDVCRALAEVGSTSSVWLLAEICQKNKEKGFHGQVYFNSVTTNEGLQVLRELVENSRSNNSPNWNFFIVDALATNDTPESVDLLIQLLNCDREDIAVTSALFLSKKRDLNAVTSALDYELRIDSSLLAHDDETIEIINKLKEIDVAISSETPNDLVQKANNNKPNDKQSQELYNDVVKDHIDDIKQPGPSSTASAGETKPQNPSQQAVARVYLAARDTFDKATNAYRELFGRLPESGYSTSKSSNDRIPDQPEVEDSQLFLKQKVRDLCAAVVKRYSLNVNTTAGMAQKEARNQANNLVDAIPAFIQTIQSELRDSLQEAERTLLRPEGRPKKFIPLRDLSEKINQANDALGYKINLPHKSGHPGRLAAVRTNAGDDDGPGKIRVRRRKEDKTYELVGLPNQKQLPLDLVTDVEVIENSRGEEINRS